MSDGRPVPGGVEHVRDFLWTGCPAGACGAEPSVVRTWAPRQGQRHPMAPVSSGEGVSRLRV